MLRITHLPSRKSYLFIICPISHESHPSLSSENVLSSWSVYKENNGCISLKIRYMESSCETNQPTLISTSERNLSVKSTVTELDNNSGKLHAKPSLKKFTPTSRKLIKVIFLKPSQYRTLVYHTSGYRKCFSSGDTKHGQGCITDTEHS